MTVSAQGIDVSSYQAPLIAATLKGLAFAFTKATEGPESADPNFAANWRVMKSAGIHRGAYHELWSSSSASPQAQAAHFLAVVKAQGLEPGDMLAVVASDYQGVTDAEVKAFADHVHAAESRSPMLVYTDLSVGSRLTSCTGYPLWISWPENTPPASVAPWKRWTFWQWSWAGTDKNAFNGTAAELQAWLDSIAYPPAPEPPADWTYGPPQRLQALGGHTTVRLSWEIPAGAPEVPAEYLIYIYSGEVANRTTLVTSYPRTAKASPWEGGGLERGRQYMAHVVAAGPGGSRVRPYTYAGVSFSTG